MVSNYISASESHIKQQRQKARQLKGTRWWKLIKSKGICHYCQQKFLPEEITMDHKVPVSGGGLSIKNNVVPSCKPCNISKKNKNPLDALLESK